MFPKCIVERTGDVNPKRLEDGFTPLGLAAQEGHLEICAFLIEYLDDKNPRENDGWTPLHRVARAGHLEVCKLLSNLLDNKNPGDIHGRIPLHEASGNGPQ